MRACVALMLLSLTACQAYVPVRAGPLPQGTPVRARLTVPGNFRLAELTANNVTLVDGEVIRADPDSLLLSAWWLSSATGYEFRAGGETVAVPRGHVAELRRRRISPARTGLFVAALAAGTALVRATLDALGGSSGGGTGGGGTPK